MQQRLKADDIFRTKIYWRDRVNGENMFSLYGVTTLARDSDRLFYPILNTIIKDFPRPYLGPNTGTFPIQK